MCDGEHSVRCSAAAVLNSTSPPVLRTVPVCVCDGAAVNVWWSEGNPTRVNTSYLKVYSHLAHLQHFPPPRISSLGKCEQSNQSRIVGENKWA